jgi:hypothetical protein
MRVLLPFQTSTVSRDNGDFCFHATGYLLIARSLASKHKFICPATPGQIRQPGCGRRLLLLVVRTEHVAGPGGDASFWANPIVRRTADRARPGRALIRVPIADAWLGNAANAIVGKRLHG